MDRRNTTYYSSGTRFTFVYLPMFAEAASDAGLTDAQRRAAEDAILHNPDAGSGIGAPGGARKLRLGSEGHGKRGSIRVIFYVHTARERVYMLYVYRRARPRA